MLFRQYPHGTLQVQAANEHSHPVCGSSCTDDSSHTNLEFAKLTGSEDTLKIGETTIQSTDNNLELPAGCYIYQIALNQAIVSL